MSTLYAKFAVFLLACFLAGASRADFIGRKGETLQANGYTYNSFTVSESTTFTLYFTSDYQASAIIIDASQLSRFTSGQSVNYYDGFDGQFGIRSFTLGAGSYVLGVRNKVAAANTISVELELWPPEAGGATFYDTYFTEVENLNAGGMLWQPFTVQEGVTYVLEGCNTGLEYYLIPAAALGNFRNGNSFSYYSEYSGSGKDPNMPGLLTIDRLAPGDYYLVFRNSGQTSKALVYAMYRYLDDDGDGNSGGGGEGGSSGSLELECECGYQSSGDTLTLSASRVNNRRSSTSGTLKLKLWATASPYSGGSISGYILGEYVFSSTLGPNQYFYDIEQRVSYRAPPSGTYYLTLTLTETSGGSDYIRDYVTFDEPKTVGSGTGTGGNGTGSPVTPHELQGVANQSNTYSSSRFRIGLTLDQGTSYTTRVARNKLARVIGTIIPEAQHIGKRADIYVVDLVNSASFVMQNENGIFVPWNGHVPDLVPYKRGVTLSASTMVDMYRGTFAVRGNHSFFLGYKVAGEALRYIPAGLDFSVTD